MWPRYASFAMGTTSGAAILYANYRYSDEIWEYLFERYAHNKLHRKTPFLGAMIATGIATVGWMTFGTYIEADITAMRGHVLTDSHFKLARRGVMRAIGYPIIGFLLVDFSGLTFYMWKDFARKI